MNRGVIFIIIISFGLWLFVFPGDDCLSSSVSYKLSSHEIPQGGIITLKVIGIKNSSIKVLWMGKELPVSLSEGKGGSCFSLVSADLMTEPGRYFVKIRLDGNDNNIPINVVAKDYGVRRLKLPDRMVRLSKKDLERVKRESKIINQIWQLPPSPLMWDEGFQLPINGEIIGQFGRRSIINGLPRSPHSGVDIRAPEGTPVRASNSGEVVLCGNFFFSGKSIIINHGMWVYSMYFHLSKILVHEGMRVKKGEIIGYSGSTGRATGPHLHFGIRVNGSRVDPLLFIKLTGMLK